jgi:hypothetical protein
MHPAVIVDRGSAQALDEPHVAVGPCEVALEFQVITRRERSIDEVLHLLALLDGHQSHESVEAEFHILRDTADPVGLVGPDEMVRGDVPVPTPDVGEGLGLGEIRDRALELRARRSFRLETQLVELPRGQGSCALSCDEQRVDRGPLPGTAERGWMVVDGHAVQAAHHTVMQEHEGDGN